MADNNGNYFIKVTTGSEQYSVIHHYVTHVKEPVKIHHKLHKGYCNNTMSRVMVWKWVKTFQEGCTDVHDVRRNVLYQFSSSE